MNKKIISVMLLILLLTQITIAQMGTSASPFTSIAQSSTVTTEGIYYFNLSSDTFSTFVSPYGWLLVANDFGGQTASNLSQVATLDLSTRGILTAAILGKFTGITFVGISSSDNNINVTTSNSTIINRVINNQSLNVGSADNGLYGTPWSGTGSSNFNSQSCGCTDATTNLNANVYHPTCDGSKFHWLPYSAQLAEIWSSGFISSAVSFDLWVTASATVSPLPIELINFDAVYNKNTNKVELNWITATETNNHFFTIEKSNDGKKFSVLKTIPSKATNGNSQVNLNYQTTDVNPIGGTLYYRLKQTDFNGNYTYFKIVSVNSVIDKNVSIYPNPSTGSFVIETNASTNQTLQVYDVNGRVVLTQALNGKTTIDASSLPSGIYNLSIISDEGVANKRLVITH